VRSSRLTVAPVAGSGSENAGAAVPRASMVDSMAMSARVTFLRREATPSSRQVQGSRGRELTDRQVRGRAARDAEQYADNTRVNTSIAVRTDGQWPFASSQNTTHRRLDEKLLNTFASRTVRRSATLNKLFTSQLDWSQLAWLTASFGEGPRAAVMLCNGIEVMWRKHFGNISKPELSCAADDYRMACKRGPAVRVIQAHINNL
jgi:hypothetical protein